MSTKEMQDYVALNKDDLFSDIENSTWKEFCQDVDWDKKENLIVTQTKTQMDLTKVTTKTEWFIAQHTLQMLLDENKIDPNEFDKQHDLLLSLYYNMKDDVW